MNIEKMKFIYLKVTFSILITEHSFSPELEGISSESSLFVEVIICHYNILNETSNAKYFRRIILFKKEILQELLYHSENQRLLLFMKMKVEVYRLITPLKL